MKNITTPKKTAHFDAAVNYQNAARYVKDNSAREGLLKKSLDAYTNFLSLSHQQQEKAYCAHLQTGILQHLLGYSWALAQQSFMKASSMKMSRGEAMKQIILHYMTTKEWEIAYIFTSYSKDEFFNILPKGQKLMIDTAFYHWQTMDFHVAVCYYLNKITEGSEAFEKLLGQIGKHPEYFTTAIVEKIKANAHLFNPHRTQSMSHK